VDDLTAPELTREDLHHLAKVLRLRTGEQVVAADGAGAWRLCEWGSAAIDPASDVFAEERPEPQVTIAFALPKGDRPEAAVRALVELGVDRIVPLITERSVVRPPAERAVRLRRVAREAAMQSRRVFLPEVRDITPLAGLCTTGAALCVPGGEPPSLALPCLVIGPEGGFTDAELAIRLPEVGLGGGVLRTETAAVVAGALLVSLRAGLVRSGA
jgi:16S rRNA (uracil1498-N3)-methyltransferase